MRRDPAIWKHRLRRALPALVLAGCLGAAGDAPATGATLPASVTYRAADGFETIRENVENAIIARGMVIGRTLHVREMLDRTGPDLGFPERAYLDAVALEFCSAPLSHRMIAADPLNIVHCPFTIAVYVKTGEPEHTYVSFRTPLPSGGDCRLAADIHALLDGIAREAVE